MEFESIEIFYNTLEHTGLMKSEMLQKILQATKHCLHLLSLTLNKFKFQSPPPDLCLVLFQPLTT